MSLLLPEEFLPWSIIKQTVFTLQGQLSSFTLLCKPVVNNKKKESVKVLSGKTDSEIIAFQHYIFLSTLRASLAWRHLPWPIREVSYSFSGWRWIGLRYQKQSNDCCDTHDRKWVICLMKLNLVLSCGSDPTKDISSVPGQIIEYYSKLFEPSNLHLEPFKSFNLLLSLHSSVLKTSVVNIHWSCAARCYF